LSSAAQLEAPPELTSPPRPPEADQAVPPISLGAEDQPVERAPFGQNNLLNANDEGDFDAADLIALNEAILMSMSRDSNDQEQVGGENSTSISAGNAASLDILMSAGFDRDTAQGALNACNYNVERAAEYLLNHL
jgi:hypothetical protein